MEIIACRCDPELPPHDHPIEWVEIDGVMRAKSRMDEFHFWVDWRAVARAGMLAEAAGG